jgi:23S rRNA pseudouridine1911/1915/1917 synthase
MPVPPRPDRLSEPTRTFSICVCTTERLDRFLADQLAFSRTHAARLVAAGTVRVNHEPARAARQLQHGDIVAVTIPESPPPQELAPRPRSLDIVYENGALLVLDKPAGLVVHPAPGHWDDTLLNALVARGTPLSVGGSGRPGIVHRLDKDTSGLLIVAKTDAAHRSLARALARRKVERTYAALIWGHIKGSVEIDAPIARHPKDRKRMAVLATGRSAVTQVDRIGRFGACDLVRVRLLTGRTHQIRVHLAHVGHPVVGDPTYGGGGARRLSGPQRREAAAIERAAPRQALHAARLRFDHPATGEALDLRSEWPRDLRAALSAAAGDHTLDRENSLQYLEFFE